VLNNVAKQILQDEYNVKGPVFYLEFSSYGLREEDLLSGEAAKEKLGLRGKTVLFSFGTLHPRKRYEVVISLIPMLRRRYPNITYIVSKALPSSNPKKGQKYLAWLLCLVRRLNVEENVVFVDYVPDNQLKYYFGASDAVIFAHRDGAYGSAASKHAMSYLARIICSDASCFGGFEDGVHCLKFGSKDDLLEKILKAVEQRPDFSDELRRKIEELDMKNHAKRHLEIYEQVSSGLPEPGGNMVLRK
jgi:glycosyltransferase involved in cell wall biosynthesis